MSAQANAWAGTFGTRYTERQRGTQQVHRVARNAAFFARALARATPPQCVVEFGAGDGANIRALHMLYPTMQAHAIEINRHAAALIEGASVHHLDVTLHAPPRACCGDLVLSKGFLIHVPPESLGHVYAQMLRRTTRYLLLAEYYAPHPQEIVYRGQAGMLWKRDFATEIMSTKPYAGTVRVVDYGFVWHADASAPQDDLTWFLLERTQP